MIFKIFKETALPGTLENNAVYLVTSTNPDYVEMYVTSSTGAARRIINEADIQTMINSAVAGLGAVQIVADITARDALTFTGNAEVWVVDASGDATVDAGGAKYLWDATNSVFIKISESESLDVSLNWADIQGGPSSTPAQIDAAVGNAHTHANKTELDKISENIDGDFQYNGDYPDIKWYNIGW